MPPPRYSQLRLFGSSVALVDNFSPEFPRTVGTFGRYFPSSRRREVLQDFAIRPPSPLADWDSPTHLARRVVSRARDAYPNAEHWRLMESFPLPIFCFPWQGDAIHLDLSAAYFSILRSFGIRNVCPFRFFSLSPAYSLPPLPSPAAGSGWKWFWTVLPGVCRAGHGLLEVAPDEFRRYPRRGVDPRPWVTVASVLYSLASLATRLGAVYVFVDSAIFPLTTPYSELTDLATAWGLTYRTKAAGHTIVRAPGAYSINSVSSGHFHRVSPSYHPLDPELAAWALASVAL